MNLSALLQRRLSALIALLGAMLLVVCLGWRTCGFRGCPDVGRLVSYQPGGGSVLVDRSGILLAELDPTEHEKVALDDLPDHVAKAFIAVEDRRFYEHRGVDWRRVGGALLANVRARAFRQGFSTISMQLARNVFSEEIPGAKRTLGRKLLEIRAAGAIEKRFRKDEILELYLNHIYFGNGARGIAAAARDYFGRPAADLDLSQAALLAAMIKAPTHYDPRRHPEAARRRRDLVLQLMADQRLAAPAEAQRAQRSALGVSARRRSVRQTLDPAPYFVEEVRRQVEERFGDAIYRQPLRVWTTLDLTVQTAAEEELERQLRRVARGDALQGALVVMSVQDGDVLAWIGGRDYRQSQFDRVRSARRQVGSAFKPFVYAAALERGFSLSQLLLDEPLRVTQVGGGVWEPHNFKDEYGGVITLREALIHSKNVATVRLANEVGYTAVASLAQRAGITGPIADLPSMALGTAQISPLELTTAYSAFAADGQAAEPRMILRVARADGSLLWESKPERRRVLPAVSSFLVTDVLRDAVDYGTSRSVRQSGFTGPAAGKTGTTNDGADAWFVGYTPELVAGIWLGFDEPRPIPGHATGGQVAAPIWGNLMRRVYATRPTPDDWQPPAGIVRRRIDPDTGRPLRPRCAALFETPQQEYFMRRSEPAAICPDEQPPAAHTIIGGESLTWKRPTLLDRLRAEQIGVTNEWVEDSDIASEPVNVSPRDVTAGTDTNAQPVPSAELPNVGGDWELTHRIEATSFARYEGLELGYRVHFAQRGTRVFGSGRKATENGRQLPPAARTPIDFEGTIANGVLKARFVEYGSQRVSDGEIVWQVPASNRLDGSFTSTVADTRGSSSGRRVQLRQAAPPGVRARQWPQVVFDEVVNSPRAMIRGLERLFSR